MRTLHGVRLVLGLALLAGACGKKGPPLPPLRHNPPPPSNLRVGQQGDSLVVSCQVPTVSVDGLKLEAVEVELVVTEGAGKAARKLQPHRAAAKPGELRTERLSLSAPGTVIAVVARAKARGGWSLPSRPVSFRVEEPPPAPSQVTANNDPAGVLVAWITPPPTPSPTVVPTLAATAVPTVRSTPGSGLAAGLSAALLTPTPPRESGYFVRRRLEKGDPAALNARPIAAPPYVDDSALAGAAYCYTVRNVASVEPLVASADAPEVCLTAKDLRPPAVPKGVALLPQAGGLEVSWSPSPEEDVIAYRVYRAAAGAALEKIAERTASERSFVDKTAAPRTKYRYVVTAVDRAGNESAQSAPVEGTVP
jgi:hypothetical protein